MTTLPAVVTILDLATTASATSTMYVEASYSSGGVATTFAISLPQIMTSTFGGLPTGGSTGQFLMKASATNYETSWNSVNLASSASVTGVLQVPYGGIGTASLTTYGVVLGNGTSALDAVAPATSGYVFQATGTASAPVFALLALSSITAQVGLSVLGVAGTATAVMAPIVGSAGQFLQVNTGGTGVVFDTISATAIASALVGTAGWPLVAQGATTPAAFTTLNVVGGGTGTATLTSNAVLLGAGTATFGLVAAATSGYSLIANGTAAAPSYQLVNLTTGATGILTVPFGGIGTSTLSANAVLLGAGSATLQFAAPSTAGNLLIDQGSTTNPAFTIVSGDVTISSAGTTTIGANKVQYSQIQTVAGLSVVGVAGTTTTNVAAITGSAANHHLAVNSGGTGLAFSLPAMVLLTTLSPSNVASVADISTLTSTYKNYMFFLNNIRPSDNSAIAFQMRVATTGSSFISANYLTRVGVATTNATAMNVLFSGVGTTISSAAGMGLSGAFYLSAPGSSTVYKMTSGPVIGAALSNNTLGVASMDGMYIGTTSPITGVQFFFSSGNIQDGTIQIFGMST